ncbi:MAG TPA: S9 family peptidase [Blastocatellia bacterium]|nr:S9 family peptidase [Blastocatellia bacterium]
MILAVLLFLLAPTVAQSQLTPEQTLTLRRIVEPRFSPDGSRIAFVVSEAAKGTSRLRHIWVLDVRSREVRRFTTSSKSEFTPRWSPDGQRLAFLSDRDGSPQIYILPMRGGESARLTEGKNGVRSFEWSPDGRQIAFLAPEPKAEAEEKKESDKDDARVVDRDDKHARVWVIDVESKKVRQLTSGAWRVSELQWMAQGQLIVSATDHPEDERNTDRIFSMVVGDGKMTEIASPRGPFGGLQVSPDGKRVAYVAARMDGPAPHDLYVQPVEGGAAKNLTAASIDRFVLDFAWRADGTLLVLAENGFRSRFYVVTQDCKAEAVNTPDSNMTTFDRAATGLVAFVGESATEPPELRLSDGKAQPETVTRINEGFARVALVKPEFLGYKSFDGTVIEGALLLPRGQSAGAKLPLVMLIHGGPTGRWTDSFEPWGQLLAARGYAVFYPNIRGSTGYGHRFVEMNRADWGGGDFKDVMAGVDFLIARGVADPNRLGIGGWSYGGYMASWAITQTNRFKAAVTGAGMTDLAMEFGTEDNPSYDEWFFGLPYEKPEGFAKSSPITYIRNARTPTLILQGEADTVDPLGQSQMLYRALKRYGVVSDFVIYPREPHGFREEKHLLDRLNRIVSWFDAHLKQ